MTGAVVAKTGDRASSDNKTNTTYEEFSLVAVGNENCAPEIIGPGHVATLLEEEDLGNIIKRFGFMLHMRTFRNHNFSCRPRDVLSKYLPKGATFWVSDSKAAVHDMVFANLLDRLSKLVDDNVHTCAQ